MAEPVEVHDVLQVTGLTPSAPAEAEPAPPAAPEETRAEPAEQPAAAETVEAESSTSQTTDAPEGEVSRETEAVAPVEQKKPSRGVQKALDRLTREREEARLQAAQALGAFQALQAQVNQQQRQPQTAPTQPAARVETAPDRKDYPDWEQFNRATAQWEARQAAGQIVRQELGNFVRALVTQQAHTNAQTEAVTKIARLEQEKAKAPERFPDWVEVVQTSDAPISASLYDAITESSDPVLVMHHLGVHPEEHAKLDKMTPKQQLMAVALIANPPSQARVSNAPAPARPVAAVRGSQGGSQYTENMTAEQHKAYMAKHGLNRGLK